MIKKVFLTGQGYLKKQTQVMQTNIFLSLALVEPKLGCRLIIFDHGNKAINKIFRFIKQSSNIKKIVMSKVD